MRTLSLVLAVVALLLLLPALLPLLGWLNWVVLPLAFWPQGSACFRERSGPLGSGFC